MKLISSTCNFGTQNVTKRQWATILNFSSSFNLLRLCCYLSEFDQWTENVAKEKHDKNIQLLYKIHFSGMWGKKEKHILNLSNYSLSDRIIQRTKFSKSQAKLAHAYCVLWRIHTHTDSNLRRGIKFLNVARPVTSSIDSLSAIAS